MRCSNPLDPVYTIADEKGSCEVGQVAGSKPAKMPDPPKDQAKNRCGSLSTNDIGGA